MFYVLFLWDLNVNIFLMFYEQTIIYNYSF